MAATFETTHLGLSPLVQRRLPVSVFVANAMMAYTGAEYPDGGLLHRGVSLETAVPGLRASGRSDDAYAGFLAEYWKKEAATLYDGEDDVLACLAGRIARAVTELAVGQLQDFIASGGDAVYDVDAPTVEGFTFSYIAQCWSQSPVKNMQYVFLAMMGIFTRGVIFGGR